MWDCVLCAGYILLAAILYKALDWLVRRFYLSGHGDRYILITGCDTGFGNLAAKRLDALGCHVMAGCLTEAGETELTKSCSTKMRPVPMDVSKPDSVRRAFEIVKAKLPPGKGLWGVLNNAGIMGAICPPEWVKVDDYKAVAAVNLYGLIDVTMTFLPLVKLERGRVVNTASSIGRFTFPLTVPYCVTKYGVEAFTDGLRRSLYPFGVKAILIEPGGHKTNLITRENTARVFTRAWEQATPDVKAEYGEEYFQTGVKAVVENFQQLCISEPPEVVDAYVHALLGRYPRARYLPGKDTRIYLLLQALPEWMSDWYMVAVAHRNLPRPAALQNTR